MEKSILNRETSLLYKNSGVQMSAASNIYHSLKYYLNSLHDNPKDYKVEISKGNWIPCLEWIRLYDEAAAIKNN